ncbi:MAG: hypothetical protein KGS46_09185 [Chloroflexi bacterium]|nr:hypothetical protein [Chloroflexota bacterium]
MKQDYNTKHKAWAAAVAATKAALIARGYTPAKAQKCALDRNKSLHPAAQAAVRRNLSLNRDYIQGGAQ